MAASVEDNMDLNMVESDESKKVTIEAEDEPVEKIKSKSPVKTKEKEKKRPVIINGAENTVFRTKELVLKVEYNGDIRKKILPNSEITYDELLRQIGRIFKCESLSLNNKLCVKYKDEDGDMVRFDTDEELQVAVLSGKTLNLKVDTSEAVKISSSEISKELLTMKNNIENLLAKLDKSQVEISPVSRENSASQTLVSSVTRVGPLENVPTPKLNNIVVQPKEITSVLGNPNPVAVTQPQEPERKLNMYPTTENDKSGNLFPNGQQASVSGQFIPQVSNMVSVPSPMHVSTASASGIFQQPGPGPVPSANKNMPSMGNYAIGYSAPTSNVAPINITNAPPSSVSPNTITRATPPAHPTAHQYPASMNTFGVPPTYNSAPVQPSAAQLNNYFTPPPPQTQNVPAYQAAPPMVRAPVAQAPPPLPNMSHPGSGNPYARSTAPRFGM